MQPALFFIQTFPIWFEVAFQANILKWKSLGIERGVSLLYNRPNPSVIHPDLVAGKEFCNIFDVSFRPGDRGKIQLRHVIVNFQQEGADVFDDLNMHGRIADDSLFTHVLTTRFELGLDQNIEPPSVPPPSAKSA